MTSHCGLFFNPIFYCTTLTFRAVEAFLRLRLALRITETQAFYPHTRLAHRDIAETAGNLTLHTVIEPLETQIHFFSPRTRLTHIQVALSKTFVCSLIKISVRPCAVFRRKGGHYRFFCISVFLLSEL